MQKRSSYKLYLKLAGILLIPLFCIILYSFSEKEIKIGSVAFEKADIASFFAKGSEFSVDSLQFDTIPKILRDTVVVDTTAQRILFFGDSMVEGLSKRMRNYAAENGHELLNVIWYSSSTKIWAQYDTLSHYIREFKPTYLMLCVGGNELFVRDLDKREEYIKTIIRKMGDKPYVWIGPPNWKEDTGINDLIEKNTGTCRYYPSKNLSFERASDGAHPTFASAAQWMDSIAVWIEHSSCYRIRMDFPQSKEQRGRTITLSPLK